MPHCLGAWWIWLDAWWIWLALVGVSAIESRPIIDCVDLIELNHLHDENGKVIIQQIILWQWSPEYRRHDVIAWRLVEDDLAKLPYRMPNGLYCARWYDRDWLKWREVRSRCYRETWTREDPERLNKRVHAERYRSTLTRIRR